MSQEGGLVLSESSLLGTLVYMNFLHYAIFLFVISICVMVIVSLATQATSKVIDPALVYQYGVKGKENIFKTKEFALTLVIIVCVLILWYVFR